jgi:hypothetical protein
MYLVLIIVILGFTLQIGGGAYLIQSQLNSQGKEGGYKTILLFLLPFSLLMYWAEGLFYETTLDEIILKSEYGTYITIGWVAFILLFPVGVSYWLICKSVFYKFLFGQFDEEDELPYPMPENINKEEEKKP